MRSSHRGFTLIELLIVVVIIAILAAIAYPSYQDQVLKSRRAEGKAFLLEVAQALEKCKTLYGVYNNANCATVSMITSPNSIASPELFYDVSANPALTTTSFKLQAVPRQADPQCGTLTLEQDGNKLPLVCW